MVGQSSQPSQAGGQSTGMPSNMNMGDEKKSEDMPAMKDHMKDHMAQMQAEMKQLKARIEKMRANAEKVQDKNTKAALLDNVEMWEHFMSQMHSHMQMMNGGGMHHMGMMPEKEGMGHSEMMDHSAKPDQIGTPVKQ
jgi:molecular chaperone GrpE (heat shock protein)